MLDWAYYQIGRVWYITPVDDLEDHSDEIKKDVIKGILSKCKCKPRIEEEHGCLFVVHKSFDGREAVEWANEILNKNNDNAL